MIARLFATGLIGALAVAFASAESADAGELSVSLRSQIQDFVAERAGGPVESISVPPLGDFDLTGHDPDSVRIELSTRARGQLSGAVAVNVVLSDDNEILKRGVVTARVQTSKRVWVASRELPRGAKITRDDLRLENVDPRSAHSGATSDLDRLLGLQLRRSMREGAIVRTRYLTPVSVVERGQTVRIVLQHAGMKIIGKGRAVTDGSVGEVIRVVNADSRREISGRVEKDGSVHVE